VVRENHIQEDTAIRLRNMQRTRFSKYTEINNIDKILDNRNNRMRNVNVFLNVTLCCYHGSTG
jgi:hypothetical protein